jgi:membrane protein DedA with SNARE-associated domain
MRAFFFVGAGLARMPSYQVVLFGGISVLAWNGVLLLIGIYIGREFETLADLVEQYSVGALIVLGLVALVWWARRWRRRG